MVSGDICFFGEALIDLYTVRVPHQPSKEMALTANLGGGILNAAVAAARWSRVQRPPSNAIHFLGGVSHDYFGQRIIALFTEEGIAHHGCYRSTAPTPLALVALDAHRERSFQFFRTESADIRIPRTHLGAHHFERCAVVAMGSNCMIDQECAAISDQVMHYAHRAGAVVAVDPNIRPSLWSEPEQLEPRIRAALRVASIIKVAEEELALIHPTLKRDDAIERILTDGVAGVPWRVLLVTCGAEGCVICYSDGSRVVCPAYPATVVDTTGAGDAFFGVTCAAMLRSVPELFAARTPLQLNHDHRTRIKRAVEEALRLASVVVGYRGAIRYRYDPR